MLSYRFRLYSSLLLSVIACDNSPIKATTESAELLRPRYGGHGGGGTVEAALQLNGLFLTGASCMGDDAAASGLVNGVKAADDFKCTSNDITFSSTVVTAYSTDGTTFNPVTPGAAISCQRGSTIYVQMAGTLTQNSNSDLADIGLWVAYDGGNAISGSCQQYTLDPFVPGAVNLDGDLCGDFQANSTTQIPFESVALQCEDGGSGALEIGTCLAWKNSGSNQTCPASGATTDETFRFGSLPGQKSRCSCSTATVPVLVLN